MDIKAHSDRHIEAGHRSADERDAEGKALREAVPREEHGHWRTPMCEFAVEYADQAKRDHRAFVKAIRQGRLHAIRETA